MEIAVLLGSIQIGGGMLVSGIGMNFLHMHLVRKGYTAWKIAMVSCSTVALVGFGAVEIVARSVGPEKNNVRQVRNLGMIPLITGFSMFAVGYGGIFVARWALLCGRNRFDKYVRDIVKK